MIRKTITALVSVIIFGLTAAAQSPLQDTWHGTLTVPGGSLTIVFHLDPDNCTADSPDQGVYDIPAELTELSSVKAHVTIPSLAADFEGSLMFGLLVGKFRQSGMEFPLSLKRGAPVINRPQTPEGPFPYSTEEVTFTNPDDGAVLSGTLILPQESGSDTPVVLFVSGSGLQNRNEEVFSHKPFLVIADRLARNGIASLRYDDRSVGKSTGNASEATTETFRNDAEAGLNYLRSLEKFSKIGLLGHSEGGTIAFMLAGDEKTDFIISLAGTSVHGKDVIVEQNRKLLNDSGVPENITDAYCNALDQLYSDMDMSTEKLEEISASLPESLRQNLKAIHEITDPWIRYFVTFDPSEHIRRITCPVLALNGEKDVQVMAEDNIRTLGELLTGSGKDILKTYPDLNHLFQHCQTGMTDEYPKIEETISDEVLTDIIGWIRNL